MRERPLTSMKTTLTEVPLFTVIAEGSRTQGSLSFFSQCIILGLVEGNIYQQSQESLTLGKSGWIRGDITSQGHILIAGRVEGNIFSTLKITVLETALITGKIVCPKVEIRSGAILESDIVMQSAKSPAYLPSIAA